MTTEFSHLCQYAIDLLDSPPQQRIYNIRQSRFIEYGAARCIREWADRMIGGPRSVRPACLMISADAGAGKTSILLHLQRCYPDATEPQSRVPHRPIVQCDVEPEPEIASVQQTLLTRLGAPLLELRTGRLRNDLIGRYLKELQTRVVIFDEAQHLLHVPPRRQSVLMDWIKWVSTSARVHVICAGVCGIELLTQTDPQLSSRFQVVHLPRWTPGPALGAFLKTYEQSLPLRRASRLWDVKMQRALVEESRGLHTATGVTDGIVRIIQEAAIAAIMTGREQIDRELLQAWREPAPVPTDPKEGVGRTRQRVDRMQMVLPLQDESLFDGELIQAELTAEA